MKILNNSKLSEISFRNALEDFGVSNYFFLLAMVFTRLRNQGADNLWISFPFVPVLMENCLLDLFALFPNDFMFQLYQISFEFLNILGDRESQNQQS